MEYSDLVNYKNAESEEDLGKYTSLVLEAHFDKLQKEKWAEKIKKDFGVLIPKDSKKAKYTALRKYLWWTTGVAAVVTMLWLYLPFTEQLGTTTEQFVTAELNQQLPYFGRRKGVEEDNKIRQQAYSNYQEKKFGGAITAFKELADKGKLANEDVLFYALSYLYNEDYSTAVFHLEEISKQASFPSHTNWYLSLAYYKNGQKALAETALRKHIALNEKGIKQKEAQFFLKRLEVEE